MIKNFSQYLIEEEREVYFTFGRFNPPTIGHGKVMDTLATKSGKADYKVYLSQSSDPKKNPLSYTDKIKWVRKMFPKHARNVILDKKVKSVFDLAVALYDQGYRKVTMVVGADRVTEFATLLKKYNGEKARHGFYNFQTINVISAGDRDPDAEGVEGMSASKQRANASKNDFVSFSQGVPKNVSNSDARKLFNDIRKGMGLKEETEFKNHVELEPVSETRERYVQGELFNVGDTVVISESEEVGTVDVLGANYVIIEMNGVKKRKWIHDVELLEKAVGEHGTITQKQIKDLERFGDRLLNKFGIDIEFTRHFADRMNDSRNKPAITVSEIQQLFKKIAKEKGANIKKHKGHEVVLKDLQKDLNLPIVIKTSRKGDEIEVVNKTIMRKKNFKTSNPVIKYESVEEGTTGQIISKLASKTLKKKKYDQAAKAVKRYMEKEKEKKGELKHDIEYYTSKVLRMMNKDSQFDTHALAKIVKEVNEMFVSEQQDPVSSARQKIDREKKSDSKRHDRMLDRARMKRARNKNKGISK